MRIDYFIGNISTAILEAPLYRAMPLKIISENDFADDLIKDKVVKKVRNFNDIVKTTAEEYRTFNDFFTRALKPGARVIDQAATAIVSCCDGTISAFGTINLNQLIQAKNKIYTLQNLFGDQSLAEQFFSGNFITTYLAPTDYHRVHMPFDGTLVSMQYIPGKLFSVKQEMIEHVDNLFTKNERLICHFNSQHGDFVVVLVGAQLVSGLETVWHGKVRRSNNIQSWNYTNSNIVLSKGSELGRFNFGSTVILCLQKNTTLATTLKTNEKIQLGENIAHCRD